MISLENKALLTQEEQAKVEEMARIFISVVKAEQGVPIWEKYTLTIPEAAAYFRIGIKKIQSIISENPYADFLIHNGNRVQIKRKKFEAFIDEQDYM